MTNFDYLKSNPQFDAFVDVAVSAERIINIDPEACIIDCRRSMEFAIKWMYSVDKSLVMPYQDNLNSLMHTEEFKDIVDADLWRRLDFIRRMGNNAAHTGKKITFDQVIAVNDDSALKVAGDVAGAKVDATVMDQGRGKKVIVYKYKRKTGYHKKNGHRQAFTQVKIDKITM